MTASPAPAQDCRHAMNSPLNSVLPSQFGAAEAPANPRRATQAAWLRRLPAWLQPGHDLKLAPLLVLGAVLLGLGSWVQFRQSALADEVQRAASAQQALTRLAELRHSTAAAEASQRGHAITGDPALLEPLAQAAPRAVALLEELRALSSGDPAQYSRLIALAPLLAQRIEQLAAAADLRHRGTAAGTAAAMAAVDNRRLQEQIQRALTELQTHADAHLLSARAQSAAAAAWTSRLTLLATLLSLGIAIGALVQNQRAKAQVLRLRRERRQQHEGRARVLQTHARLMESSLAPIAFLDREGRILRINPAFERLLGQPQTALAGTPMVQHLLPDDLRKTERALDAAATAPQTLAHRWRRADGSVLHLRWSAQLAHDDGTLVCVAQDDTEARTLAATLAQQQESLQQGALGLADATERKAGAERSLNEFLATLSRCLRSPLSALLQQTTNGQQGVHGAQDAAVARAWSQALERTRGMQEAVEHVLLLGRMQAGQLALQREAFDVGDTLQRTVELVQGPAERKGLQLQLQLADDLGYAHGDTRRVEQALLHLMQDVVATTDAGQVNVAAQRRADGLIHFEIAHHRADSDGASLDELLAPLHDADKPASAERLTQLLGVAMARTLLQHMGGTLDASLQPPRGCVVTVTLPADQLPLAS